MSELQNSPIPPSSEEQRPPESSNHEPKPSFEQNDTALTRWLQSENALSSHEKAELAQEIVALRKDGQARHQRAGKVKEYATNSTVKSREGPADDTENIDEELGFINTIMNQLSVAEDGQGEAPSKEDLLRIYLGFYAEREIKLSVKVMIDVLDSATAD
ncbi:hypothetical protein HFD88_003246 [Aspergillus terreus]|nr:hypothetical protein HFD88_003246 [Aspergillus terreus]